MKRKTIIMALLITLILEITLIYITTVIKLKPTFTNHDYIENILTHNLPKIDRAFLTWIEETYGIDKTKQLKEYLETNQYNINIWHKLTGFSIKVLEDKYNNLYENMDNVSIIEGNKDEVTISFIGDVSLADNFDIMPYYDSRGGITGILEEDLIKKLNESDILIANNEFTISNRGEKMPNKLYTFKANPSRVKIYNEMGVDLVTLANNHVYDFGYDAFMDTLAILKENEMPYIGAGANIEEATKPYYFIINGYKIGFVNATRAEKYIMTPEATLEKPGVLRNYDPEKFTQVISDTKKNSDYVIALIHWGKEDSHELEQVQITTGKLYIDSGADLIIGTHAHVLQGMEYYNNKLIVYNLGDFIFNRESKDTGILDLKLSYNGEMNYTYIPCYQTNYKTSLLSETDKKNQLINMQKWSINALFDNEGNITESK